MGEQGFTEVLLRFLRCAACALLEVLPGRTYYKISRTERTHLPLNLSQMSEDSGSLGIFAVCQEITLLGKHTNKTSKESGREDDH